MRGARRREVARILSVVVPRPRRTILVGLWSGEEQGLNGSRAFTEDHPEVVEGLQALFNQDNGTGRIVNLSPQGFTSAAGTLSWHTHRDTFDKVVFDDLRNNVVLTASLAYLAASSDERMSRDRREIITDSQGGQAGWPECQPVVRRSSDSPRMQ